MAVTLTGVLKQTLGKKQVRQAGTLTRVMDIGVKSRGKSEANSLRLNRRELPTQSSERAFSTIE